MAYSKADFNEHEVRQQDEFNSIKSIYGDIIKDITPTKLVWNKKPSPHFQVFLQASEVPERPKLSLTLDIEFTTTYPLSAPVVKIVDAKNVSSANYKSLKVMIDELIKNYAKEEVSFIIISELQIRIDELQHHVEKTLSLEEEREIRLRTERLELEKEEAKIQQEQEDAKRKESKKLNEQILQIQDEYYNESPDGRESPDDGDLDLIPEDMTNAFSFENSIIDELPGSKVRFKFKTVVGFIPYEGDDILASVGRQFLVSPYISNDALVKLDEDSFELSYVLTEIDLVNEYWASDAGKREVQDLEAELQKVINFQHTSISKLIGFQIDKMENSSWKVRLLNEHSMNSVSLQKILTKAGFVNWALARVWFIQLLSGIEFLHNSGCMHKLLTPKSISVYSTEFEEYPDSMVYMNDSVIRDGSSTVSVIKMKHPAYGFKIYNMLDSHSNNFCESSNGGLMDSLILRSWQAPELHSKIGIQPKSDIWNLGVLFMRLMLGEDTLETTYRTPTEFHVKFSASGFAGAEKYAHDVYDLLSKLLQTKVSKRPSPMELNAVKFLRDGPTKIDSSSKSKYLSSDTTKTFEEFKESENSKTLKLPGKSDMSLIPARTSRARQNSQLKELSNSATNPKPIGRYERDFEEIGKLGKGGFGEVVKARNRMEGSFYAIKRIKHKAHKLDSLLSEVLSLARLNHQYIVRYYGTWVEDSNESGYAESDVDSSSDDEFQGPTNTFTSSFIKSHDDSFQVDFISNPLDPQLNFSDSEEEEFDDRIVFANSDDNGSDGSTLSRKGDNSGQDTPDGKPTHSDGRNSQVPPSKSILYIQMEFCENNTLQNLIHRGLPNHPSEYWRLFRELLEAVSYIHRAGFIHRDLKPSNIFIDESNNIKVGDFGLAKNSQFSSVVSNNNQVTSENNSILSTAVGTVFYTAKEVATGKYDEKVDMYSLGIMFFEMVYSLATGMERAHTLNNLRLESVIFPSNFSGVKYRTERKIIKSLLDHDPKRRPGAAELLQSGWLPVEHQDQVIKEVLKSLADPASPWQQQVRETLFNQPYSLAEDLLFENYSKASNFCQIDYTVDDYLLFSSVVNRIFDIFKNHGAVQDMMSNTILPRSPFYTSELVYEYLDRNGRVLTLPFDLVLPNARVLSRSSVTVPKVFRHEFIYRPNVRGNGLPDRYSAINFDVVSHDPKEKPHSDAECIKVVDEIFNLFPCFNTKSSESLIVINHSDILSAVIEFSFGNIDIDRKQLYEISGVLSQLGVDKTAGEMKTYLRADFKVPHTVIRDLIDGFDFTADFDHMKRKLQKLMVDSPLLVRVEKALKYLESVLEVVNKLGLKCSVVFNPLSNYNNKYYNHGIMFQGLFRIDKNRRFTRIVTGGRYDSLIASFVNTDISKTYTPFAVGFTSTSTLLFVLMKNFASRKANNRDMELWKGSRCDVLITSSKKDYLVESGFDIAKNLWSHNISCDLVKSQYQDVLDRAETEGINWIVTIKQSNSTHTKKTKKQGAAFKPLRVRNIVNNKDTDIEYENLTDFLISDIEERTKELETSYQTTDRETSMKDDFSSSRDYSSISAADGPLFSVDIDQKVTVVPNDAPKGRKNNKRDKWEIENDSKLASAQMIKKMASSPIVVVDARDEALDMISLSSIHQPEEWMKKVIFSSNNLPKSFAHNIHNALFKESLKGHKWAIVYSPKTEKTCLVDLER